MLSNNVFTSSLIILIPCLTCSMLQEILLLTITFSSIIWHILLTKYGYPPVKKYISLLKASISITTLFISAYSFNILDISSVEKLISISKSTAMFQGELYLASSSCLNFSFKLLTSYIPTKITDLNV
ncbi:hypothetical protein D3C76_732930 [compost metagenome]